MPKSKPWTNAEEKFLKENLRTLSLSDLAVRLKRPYASVDSKAKRMGLDRSAESSSSSLDKELHSDEQKVLKFLSTKDRRRSILEVAEYLDKAPSTVEKILKELKKKHYNIKVNEDVQQVSLMAEPPTGRKKVIDVEKYFGSAREVQFGVISDLHYCNIHSREELIALQYEIFKKEGIDTVFELGNMIDGEAWFNKYELKAWGIEGQIAYLISHAPKIEGINTYFVTGDDHEGWLPKRVGLDIGGRMQESFRKADREDWHYLSHMESDIQFKTKEGECVVRLTHPGGGTAYALSYSTQKTVESLQGGEKPHVLIEGHYHKIGYWMIRNVHTMLAGCFEDQTTFMRKKKIQAMLGGWVVRMTLSKNGTVLKFRPEMFPYFDRKIYQINRDHPVQGWELTENIPATPRVVL